MIEFIAYLVVGGLTRQHSNTLKYSSYIGYLSLLVGFHQTIAINIYTNSYTHDTTGVWEVFLHHSWEEVSRQSIGKQADMLNRPLERVVTHHRVA